MEGIFMKKFVEKNINGRVYKFRLSMAAQSRIENYFNCAFAKMDHENLRAEDFARLIYLTLDIEERNKTTFETFFDLLDEHLSLKEIYKLFEEISTEAFGKNEIPVVEEVDDVENGTGTKPFATLS
jgi:hypothetical protein